jgi:signal peptidase I
MRAYFSLRALRRDLVTMAIAVAIVVSARSSLADHYVVPTGSMLPTVQLDDHVLVDKLAYGLRVPLARDYAVRFADPARGDVVVLRSPDGGEVLLKRVVAVPGDDVRVVEGALTIGGHAMPIVAHDGASIEQLGGVKHAVSLAYGGGPDYGPLRVPADRFLVMGDNRGNSRDGRYFGLVTRDAILGRVEGVVLRHGSPTWVGLAR